MLFHKDLQPYAHFHVPINRLLLALSQKPMGFLYKLEHSDDKVCVHKRRINGIRVLIYEPMVAKEKTACMIFFHGGGFVFNAAPHHFNLARAFVRDLDIKCVFVDYRLAPKYKFPCAPNDCFDVYKWVLSKAQELGIDCKKIILCGDSAGGNLASVTCLRVRDENLQMPCAQMLLYPVVDNSMKYESYTLFQDTPMCNSKDIAKYYKLYLPSEKISLIDYLSPIEAKTLQGLPATHIEVAQYDCLHDEGVAFASKLEKNGVKVELHEILGAMHEIGRAHV